ncbi:methyl-accepting chemotaxis protein [Paenibacillus sp. HN-1]|uniref:methyl-accepting chemotaxis protein n=1 Tax=Paenibacillus TaxID=44249 RepID=UPI001CA9403B|nr:MULTISPECIES: methyl-accepting chemotaxis protein [Paenibacillus]MBY9077463.1 methyl-accepting chemotaxis protein [Paenibacillus sp. CGMCC 1.18879]MBY9084760.1 methyl-accepting chemotaxis protein [Paenibacillus sinensis]
MKNLKLRTKMWLLTIIVLLSLLSVGISGTITGQQLAGRSKDIYQHNLLPAQWISQIRLNNEMIKSDVLALLLTEDLATNDKLTKDIEAKIAGNDEATKKLKQLSFGNAVIPQKLNEYEALLPEYRAKREQIIVFGKANQNTQAYKLYSGEFNTLNDKMYGLLNDIGSQLQQDAENTYEAATSQADKARNTNIILIVVYVLISIAASRLILGLITKPLAELRNLMSRAEKGDLTAMASYSSRDEIGQIIQSYNTMMESLRRMLHSVSESAETLSASSEQMSASAEQTSLASNLIASTATELASGFEIQVNAIAETHASVQAMAEDIGSVQKGTGQMSELMALASDSADRGAEKVAWVSEQMTEINTSMIQSQDTIDSLARLSGQISEIITTINDIAGQTNLLSLNASIEAARAGEAGRGFAVVAGEIRKLSEETAKSSLHITDIITQIQQQTRVAVESMDGGARLASEGVEGSREIAEAFGQIVGSIQDAIHQMQKMNKSVSHVSDECGDLVEVMNMVNEVTQKGAAGVEDVSASSQEQMSAMEEMSNSARYVATVAEELQKDLSEFKL